MDTKKIVVTGGSGFIGTHFISDFSRKYDNVVNVDISPPFLEKQKKIWKKIDILDYDKLKNFFDIFQPTHVLHLAARTDLYEKKSLNGYAVNVQGVSNLVRAIKNTSSVKRLIVASSMLVCKVGHIPKCFDEFSPENLYAESKVLTEKTIINMDPDCIWSLVRPTTIWGPYHNGLKNGFFKILNNKLYFHPGRKKCLKSYGYVRNTVYQIQKIFESEKNIVNKEVFYLADDPIDLKDWVDRFSISLLGLKAKALPYSCMKLFANFGDFVEFLFKIDFPMNSFRLRNMTIENVVNVSRINSICGKMPFTLSEGITQTSSWIKQGKF